MEPISLAAWMALSQLGGTFLKKSLERKPYFMKGLTPKEDEVYSKLSDLFKSESRVMAGEGMEAFTKGISGMGEQPGLTEQGMIDIEVARQKSLMKALAGVEMQKAQQIGQRAYGGAMAEEEYNRQMESQFWGDIFGAIPVGLSAYYGQQQLNLLKDNPQLMGGGETPLQKIYETPDWMKRKPWQPTTYERYGI